MACAHNKGGIKMMNYPEEFKQKVLGQIYTINNTKECKDKTVMKP